MGQAAVGLAAGLLIQRLFFAPTDLPQYGMNVTTLQVPLFATAALAHKVIPADVGYADIRSAHTLELYLAHQGGIVLWVGFWALYSQGFDADNLSSIGSFAAAYMTVVLLEPLIDLAILAIAKTLRLLEGTSLVERSLNNVA